MPHHRRLFLTALLTVTLLPALALANWHEDAFFGLHYDLHPGATDTVLGRDTTHEHIRAMLEKVKPDFVQYDCKGHPGWTGYPTKVGSPSPGIVNDALRIWRDVTRDMGIPLSVHYSGVWDTRAIELHPEWARINEHGKPDPNNTCRTSAYDAELMIPQLIEVVTDYDIDGIWIDGENWASKPCWCERCASAFTAQTGLTEIPRKAGEVHWAEWLTFQRGLFTQHVASVVAAVHAVKPGCMVTSNWMYSVRQPEPMTVGLDYLSGDFDPSFGAERASAEARFIGGRGKPWDLMAWSFLNTGAQGYTQKPAIHLCQEIAVVLAQGGSVFIYDQPQRPGRLTPWHQDVFAEVADWCRARKDYSFRTQTIPQIAVLHSESSYYAYNDPLFNFGPANQPLEGALHALLESGYSVDLLNEQALLERMHEYPAVVVPEAEGLPESVKTALRTYVEAGGRLLLSGTHVAAQYSELAGIAPRAGEMHAGFVPAGNGVTTVGGTWQAIDLTTAVPALLLYAGQEPELQAHDFPAAALNRIGQGAVLAIPGPIFRGYLAAHYPGVRRFIADAFAALDTPGLIRVEGPWWIEMSARQKDGRYLIQLVNRAAAGHLAPNRHMVEAVPNAGPFTLRIPLAERPKRVYLAPSAMGLDWSWESGILTARIAGLDIHNVLVVER